MQDMYIHYRFLSSKIILQLLTKSFELRIRKEYNRNKFNSLSPSSGFFSIWMKAHNFYTTEVHKNIKKKKK